MEMITPQGTVVGLILETPKETVSTDADKPKRTRKVAEK